MILETAIFFIRLGEHELFEAAFAKGRIFIERSRGCHRLELRRGIEAPQTYILIVWWDTLEDHTRHFKESENFTQWRAVIGHLFAAAPVVHHYAEDV